MKKHVWSMVCAAFFVWPVLTGWAQERDTQLWMEIDLELPFSKRLSALGSQEVRLKDDVTEFSLYRTQLGLEYELFSFLKLSGMYRLSVKPDELEHSAHVNSTVEVDIDPLEISWRLRLLRDFAPDDAPTDEVRNKFGIDFKDIKDIVPYVASEVYYFPEGKNRGFSKYRWYAGIKRDLAKNQSVQIYYLYQREFRPGKTEVETVLGLGYDYKL